MDGSAIPSMSALARSALAHPGWPSDTRAHERSLATILGRLDQGAEADWLTDRPGVQQVLAELLSCAITDLRGPLRTPERVEESRTRVRLTELRNGRPLDLQEEALPPGLPTLVTLPGQWTQHIWLAEPGAGKTLVRRWLQARGLCETTHLRSPEGWARLASSGPPVFIDADDDRTLELLAGSQPKRPFCLAMTAQDPDGSRDRLLAAGFGMLHSPPTEDWLESLVGWTSGRLSNRSPLEVGPTLNWLNEGPRQWGALTGLADALGWLGVVDEYGLSRVEPSSPRELLALLLRRRTALLSERRELGAVNHRKTLPEVLIGMARHALLDDPRPWLAPRSFEDWVGLIPPEHQRGPDLDWLRAQSRDPHSGLRSQDVERAAKRLPPGAHRLVTTLRELELLVPRDAESFALRPYILARLASYLAHRALMQGPCFSWGEGLLRPLARSGLLSALDERVRHPNSGVVDELLEALDEESLPLVAGFEATFVAVGLDCLRGNEVLPEQAQLLLEEQAALLVTDSLGVMTRRLETVPVRHEFDAAGCFWLAALAISENLPGTERAGALMLWREPPDSARWAPILECIEAALVTALQSQASWLGGAFGLLDRLRQQVGLVGQGKPHRLLYSGLLLDELELGVLEFESVVRLFEAPWLLTALELHAARRGHSPAQLGNQCFLAFYAAGSPVSAWSLLLNLPMAYWAGLPLSLGRQWLSDGTALEQELPLAWFDLKIWDQWLERQRTDNSGKAQELRLPTDPRLWEAMPERVGERLTLGQGRVPSAVLPLVWRRWPRRALERLIQLSLTNPEWAVDWLATAPPSEDEALLKLAEKSSLLELRQPLADAWRKRLHQLLQRRTGDTHRCYALWLLLERRWRQL